MIIPFKKMYKRTSSTNFVIEKGRITSQENGTTCTTTINKDKLINMIKILDTINSNILPTQRGLNLKINKFTS